MRTLAAPVGVSAALMLTVLSTHGAFVPKGSFGVGANPVAVGVGDFNHDGRADLAVANQGSQNVSVLLGLGDGTFQSAVNYSAGQYPNSLAMGDFDSNGHLDLAVANSGDPGGLSVLLGDGSGAFLAGSNYITLADPVSLAVADFNGDTRLDVAAAHYLPNGSVSIFLGRGDGTFQSPVGYAAGRNPLSVAVGDFNGDTRPDLAVANDQGVSILLGNGNGTFQDFNSYAAGDYAECMAVGNFNTDSYLDLAVVNDNDPGTVSILLGNGDGSFRAPTAYATKSYPLFVGAADLSRDSRLDLAVVDEAGVSVLLGNGNGTFGGATNFTAGSNPISLALAEFSGDGWLDLAVANYNPAGTVSTLLNTGGPPGLREALDASNLVWTTSGALPWIYQANITHDQVDAARSGRILRGKSSIMQTTVVGPGTLSFWWKVSSDTLDRLQFFIDGTVKPRARRTWQKPTFLIPAGSHVLRWQYKNLAATGRRNSGFVDEVSFVPAVTSAQLLAAEAAVAVTEAETAVGQVAINLLPMQGQIKLTWSVDESKRYQVLFKDNLSDPDWQILAVELIVNDGVVSVTDAAVTPQRFYRVTTE
jgi:hypothetical protein